MAFSKTRVRGPDLAHVDYTVKDVINGIDAASVDHLPGRAGPVAWNFIHCGVPCQSPLVKAEVFLSLALDCLERS